MIFYIFECFCNQTSSFSVNQLQLSGTTKLIQLDIECLSFFIFYSVREILHDRMNLPSNIFRTVVRVVVEIRNAAHEEELHEALSEEFPGDLLEWDKGAWRTSEHGSHYNVLRNLKSH